MIPIALRHLRLPVLLGLLMQCAGCSTQRPVLYPNEHYTTVGDAVAQGDIDACMTQAKEYVKAGGTDAEKAEEAAKQTGFGAASGAAIGAIGGAVGGGGAGQGVAVGAATGATAGLIHGLFRIERHPIEITEKAFDRFLQGPILKLGSRCSAQLAIRLDYNPRLALELH
jgi:outer membrane lipoprotein SlyB